MEHNFSFPNNNNDDNTTADTPTVIATGYSTLGTLDSALEEAVGQALQSFVQTNSVVDLAIVSISSLYDASPATVLQTIQQCAAAGLRTLPD